MIAPSGHPSFLALDRLALTQAVDAATLEHTATCATCSEYVAAIRKGQDVPRDAFLPRKPVRRIWRRLAAAAIVAGTGAALVVGVKLATTPSSKKEYTTVKGHPAVALYVKRGEQVFLWSSERHVMPGDRLRLEVAPDGFSYVTVLSKPNGLPIATTHSPTSSLSESPSGAVARFPLALILMTAISVFGSLPMTLASNSRSSASLTRIFSAFSTT